MGALHPSLFIYPLWSLTCSLVWDLRSEIWAALIDLEDAGPLRALPLNDPCSVPR